MERPGPPCPPRPDLDNDNVFQEQAPPIVPPQMPLPGSRPGTKYGPPPIPSRPDLGEETTIEAPYVPKKELPSVALKKKPGSIRSKGRPEITIVSAQPMGHSNIISPPRSLPPSVASQAAPEPTQLTSAPLPIIPQPAPPTPLQTVSKPIPPVPSKPDDNIPERPVRKSKTRQPPQRPKSKPVCDLPLMGEALQAPVSLLPIKSTVMEGERYVPVAAKPSEKDEPQAREPERENGSFVMKSKPKPTVIKPTTKSSGMRENSELDTSKLKNVFETDPVQSAFNPLPLKKSKPAPSVIRSKPNGMEESKYETHKELEKDGVENMEDLQVLPQPKKSKQTVIVAHPAQKREAEKDLGTEETVDRGKTQKPEVKTKPAPPAKKSKPGVSSKPQDEQSEPKSSSGEPKVNGIETINNSPPKLDSPPKRDSHPVKPKSRPTVIIPKNRKGAGSSKETIDEKVIGTVVDSSGISGQGQAELDVKHRPAPTIIVGNKTESQREAMPQSGNAEGEGLKQNKNTEGIQGAGENIICKPKKEPRIIRPNRQKKEPKSKKSKLGGEGIRYDSTNESITVQGELNNTVSPTDNTRGMPEGECKENMSSVVKKVPNRKAPTRPGPPKPGPPRPGPTMTCVTSAKDIYELEKQKEENMQQGTKTRVGAIKHPKPFSSAAQLEDIDSKDSEEAIKPKPPRPATIGREKEDMESEGADLGEESKKPGRAAPKIPKQQGDAKQSRKHSNSSSSEAKSKPLRPNAPAPKKEIPVVDLTPVSSVQQTKIEPSAIALYDYDTNNADDLAFWAGDEIFLVQKIDKDWYIGRCGDREGMMPVSFVEIIEDLPPETTKKFSSRVGTTPASSLNVMALYDFTGKADDELSIRAGDTLHLLEMVSDDWIRGKLNGKTGIFPAGFVDVSPELKLELSNRKLKADAADVKPKITGNVFKRSELVASGPRCRALYDYHSDNPGDLSFVKNDVIRLKERVDADWTRGELHGKLGMFPAAFVEVLEDLPVEVPKPDIPKFPTVTAIYDYTSDVADDLSFSKGDGITVVNRISDEWLEGEVHGRRGMFPASFVENVDLPHQQSNASQVTVKKKKSLSVLQDDLLPKAKALHDFDGEEDDELTFKAGDVISLLSQVNDEWLDGELNNKVGRFPVAFVEILVPLP